MFNKFYIIVKRLVFSFFLIYAFDSYIYPLNSFISINFYTIFFVALFGIPGMIGLIVLLFMF